MGSHPPVCYLYLFFITDTSLPSFFSTATTTPKCCHVKCSHNNKPRIFLNTFYWHKKDVGWVTAREIKSGDSVLCGGCGETFEAAAAAKAIKREADAKAKIADQSGGSHGQFRALAEAPMISASLISSSNSSSSSNKGKKRQRGDSSSAPSDKPPSSGGDEQTDL